MPVTRYVSLSRGILAFALAVILLSGCVRETKSNIDAVTFPYSVFFGNASGEVWNTNDGVNFRSYQAGDGVAVTNLLIQGEVLFSANGVNIRRHDDINIKNLKYTYGINGMPFLNPYYKDNIHYCESEDRIYVTQTSGSPVAYTNDLGETWENYGFNDFTDPNNFESEAVQVDDHVEFGVYFLTPDAKLFKKEFNTPKWTKQNVTNLTFDPTAVVDFLFVNEELMVYRKDGALEDMIFINPRTRTITKKIAPPIVNFIFSVKQKDKNNLLFCTDDGLINLNLTSGIYSYYRADIPADAIVFEVALKNNTYRSENEEDFIYVATSKGLYKSSDNGQSFVKVYSGDIRSVN